MYRLSEEQIDYILNDIRRGGIETEDLQLNLLDHICCIIERELGENDDFGHFYHSNVHRLYKNNLREIEEETVNLLTFKNYYTMRKVMIRAGVLSATFFIIGSIFKLQHWPGAGVLIVLGIVSFSLLFLPLLCIMKAREVRTSRDRMVVALAGLIGILFSLATMFTVMHWPGANVLWFSSVGVSGLVLLPVYFFTGIRHPETRLNTSLMSVLILGISGLQFTLLNTRPGPSQGHVRVQAWIAEETLLQSMQPDSMSVAAASITNLCTQIKSMALANAADNPTLKLREGRPGDEFTQAGQGVKLLAALQKAVYDYNKVHGHAALPYDGTLLDNDLSQTGYQYTNLSLLTAVTQLQMYLANAEGNHRIAAVIK